MYAKRKHITVLRDIEVNYTRTGFGGLWGNKGGVSVRMQLNGNSICIVSCHLAAHDHKLNQRIKDYHSIISEQKFYSLPSTILSHEYVQSMLEIMSVIIVAF